MPFFTSTVAKSRSSETTARRTGDVGEGRGRRAIVVGAGFGGIAASLRLRARGYDVTVVDRVDHPGGRAQVYRRGGFTYDAGPTVVTAPFLFEELFELFGKQLSDYVDLVPVEPWYRYQFPDGKTFDYGGSLDDTLAEIARFDPADAEGYRRLVDMSEKIFDKGFTELADQPFHRISTMLKTVPALLRLKSYKTVSQLVKSFIGNEQLRQAFCIHPLLVGGNPYDTTSIYSLIHFLERRWGVHFPMGGTGALVNGLARLMDEEGVEFRGGCTVERLVVERGAARGVVLESGETLSADLVVVNGDPPFLYKNMVDAKDRRRWTDRRVDRMKYSMGLFVLYFGTTKQYPDVPHHTIVLGPRFEGLLKDIFHKKVLTDDFSVYLHRPTATDPSLAPEGQDGFYALVPVPNLQGNVDWDTAGPALRDRLVDYLDDRILPGLRETITEDFYVTPKTFEDRFLSYRGSGFSIQPIFRQSAWFRFHNVSEDVDDLYLVGAGTHPGAGMPGVLCSAKILDRVVPEPAGL
ncbi:MAG: phytoene desaturase family protein [Planctomycetota bacterium]